MSPILPFLTSSLIMHSGQRLRKRLFYSSQAGARARLSGAAHGGSRRHPSPACRRGRTSEPQHSPINSSLRNGTASFIVALECHSSCVYHEGIPNLLVLTSSACHKSQVSVVPLCSYSLKHTSGSRNQPFISLMDM